MITLSKVKNLFQIKNLIIISLISAIVKLIEQIFKGQYFYDFYVYINALKVLNNYGSPYLNNIYFINELPYLYPPIISKLLEISNEYIFSLIYIVIFVSIIFLAYFFSDKKIKIPLLISLGANGILIKSLMTGNISNIFYFLVIISIIFYYKKKSFLPYYFSVFLISIVKFNFVILFLLPIIVNKNKKKEFLSFITFTSLLTMIYIFQYIFMNLEFINFMNVLKGHNLSDAGSSIFSYLNYWLGLNFIISAIFHSTIFGLLLGFTIYKKNNLNPNFFLLIVLILLIFINPRIKLYDAAFGIVFLNMAVIYFNKKIVLNFFIFNVIIIFLIKEITKYFDVQNAMGSPTTVTWYIFILFFSYFFKRYEIINLKKIN